jgi:hypothetical protein
MRPLPWLVAMRGNSVRCRESKRFRSFRGIKERVTARTPVWPVMGEFADDAIGEPLPLQPVHLRTVADWTCPRFAELLELHGFFLSPIASRARFPGSLRVHTFPCGCYKASATRRGLGPRLHDKIISAIPTPIHADKPIPRRYLATESAGEPESMVIARSARSCGGWRWDPASICSWRMASPHFPPISHKNAPSFPRSFDDNVSLTSTLGFSGDKIILLYRKIWLSAFLPICKLNKINGMLPRWHFRPSSWYVLAKVEDLNRQD